MSDDAFGRRSTLAAVISFAVAVILIAIDLYIDFAEGVGPIHLVAEIFVCGVAISGTVILCRQLDRTRSEHGSVAISRGAPQWQQTGPHGVPLVVSSRASGGLINPAQTRP